ncbi:hypothetical protein QL285_075231 [Trifolium repens]|nr:hypothetical protein QL285_075231 [Trifolium repens]
MAGGDKDNDNRRTKLKSASSRRANAAEIPHIKRARKKPPASQSDAAPSTAGPEPQPQPQSQPHPESRDVEPQPQPAGDVEADATGATGESANVVEEMELEEAMTEGEERDLITPVSNSGKVACFKHEQWNADWWEPALKATWFMGLS